MHWIHTDREINEWEELTKGQAATCELVIKVDGRRLVTRRDLRRIWDISPDTVEKYDKMGMPRHALSKPRMTVYNLEQANAWKTENLSPNLGWAAKRNRERAIEGTLDPVDTVSDPAEEPRKDQYALREIIAKTEKSEEDLKLARIKRLQLEESLVPADDLDKAMAEQAILHKTEKINDEKVLPTLLANKEAHEIAELLYGHNVDRLANLDRLVNKVFKDTQYSLYEVVEATLERMQSGVSPESIIGAINAL